MNTPHLQPRTLTLIVNPCVAVMGGKERQKRVGRFIRETATSAAVADLGRRSRMQRHPLRHRILEGVPFGLRPRHAAVELPDGGAPVEVREPVLRFPYGGQ
jgi:hypothetical protein